MNTIQDNIAEGTEQFELYFENLPSEFATAGTRDTVCVSIVDDEGIITTYNYDDCGYTRILHGCSTVFLLLYLKRGALPYL